MTHSTPRTVPVPTGVAALTPEWLTEALRESGHIRGDVAVTALDIAEVGVGRGYTCHTRRLTPTYDGPHQMAPATLIAKVPSRIAVPDEFRANILAIQAAEVHWYREMAPDCPVNTPVCYWSGISDGGDVSALLLEDLKGFRTTDQAAGATREEATLVVEGLARVHARWWADTGLLQKQWVRGPDYTGTYGQSRFASGWPAAQRLLGGKLPPEFRRIGDALCERLGEVAVAAAASAWTLAHGDFRVENFLFGEPGSPRAFCLLDWQAASRGSGLVDLGYFIGQSLQPESRRSHERELVDLYFDTLRASGIGDYNRTQCGSDYRRGLLVATWIALAGFGALEQMIAAGPGDVTDEERHTWQEYIDTLLRLLELMATRSTLAVVEAEAGRELQA